jgi:hypothetical protein
LPLLFHGTLGELKKPRLYAANLRPIETDVFDSFKIPDLAPRSKLPLVALFWYIRGHSVFAWHDHRGIEQSVFVPQILKQPEMFMVCRSEFATVMPPSLTFRISNDYEPYSYD